MAFLKKPNEERAHGVASSHPPALSALPPSPLHPPKQRDGQNRSVIDACLQITGILEGDGELQIDGQVHGDIRCSHLIVGQAASVNGSIAADEVVVRGHVNGAIGANRVMLTEGSRVESDILHKKLVIEEGAHFEGAARVRDNPVDELLAVMAEVKAAEAATNAASAEEGSMLPNPAG